MPIALPPRLFASPLPWALAASAVAAPLIGSVEDLGAWAWQRDMAALRWWTWLSAHLVHLGSAHWAVNAGVAIALALAAERLRVTRCAAFAVAGAWLAISVGLAASVPRIEWYAGASGLLHGLFAGIVLAVARSRAAGGSSRPMRLLGWALFLGGAVKCAIEWAIPVGALGWLGLPLATSAHAWGYVGGSLGTLGAMRTLRR